MQQAAEKRLKARRKKPNSPPRTPSLPRLNSCDDMLDVQRNTNHDVDTDALRREAADERMLSSVRRTQSCGTLGGLVVPPSPPRSNGKKFSRKGVRKVPSKSSLRFVSRALRGVACAPFLGAATAWGGAGGRRRGCEDVPPRGARAFIFRRLRGPRTRSLTPSTTDVKGKQGD